MSNGTWVSAEQSDASSSCTESSLSSSEPMSAWQVDSGLTGVVLNAVLSWLDGAELACAGAVCRAWRAAAACPAHWRRLLMPHAARTIISPGISWREEYVRVHAGWELLRRLSAPAAGPLLHAALDRAGRRLALTTDDAQVLIWELDEDDEEWREVWRRSMRSHGWERVSRAQWAQGGTRGRGNDEARLLLAGPVALALRWELLVLQPDEDGGWCVASRSSCSAGAAGCWAGDAGGAYLALELRRLAPHHHLTTVYINAATQEAQSEYAGVTAPLLNIFNEDDANITHIVVADVPLHDAVSDDDDCSSDEYCDTATDSDGPAQVLVAGFGGRCGAVRAWFVRALQPPPLLAASAGDLRARVARSRAAAAARAAADADAELEPEPEMTEDEVRAMCTPPHAECRLAGTLIGLTVQNDGRCIWACVSGGALSAWTLPDLRPLRQLSPPPALHSDSLHYVHPAVGRGYLVTPEGGLSGRVWMWGARSGAPRPTPLEHAAPALAAAFPRTRRLTLLVLATDHLFVWKSTATPQMSEYEVSEMYQQREDTNDV